MIPLGVQFATSANVGGQIGAGNFRMARIHALTHQLFSLLLMSMITVVMSVNEDFVASLFTKDALDIKYILEVFDYIELYLLLAAISGINMGIVRALGK